MPGVAQSVGTPTDVIASVETRPPVLRAEFDRWMGIAGARDGQTPGAAPIPVPDHPEYAVCAARVAKTKAGRSKTPAQRRAQCRKTWEGLRDQVLGFLLAARWVQGEAAEQGISVTPQQVAKAFAQQKKQAFPKDADYRKFLRESGSTEADIRFQLEIELLQQGLVAKVTKGSDRVTRAEIEAYYRENREEFRSPERREIRYVVTSRRAEARRALDQLRRGVAWRTVARRFSRDRQTRAVVEQDELTRRLDRAIFAASRGRLVGPVRGTDTWWVIRVDRVRRGRSSTLKEATPTITSLLESRNQQRALDAFVESYRAKWKARTGCLQGYVAQDCGAALPPQAPPA